MIIKWRIIEANIRLRRDDNDREEPMHLGDLADADIIQIIGSDITSESEKGLLSLSGANWLANGELLIAHVKSTLFMHQTPRILLECHGFHTNPLSYLVDLELKLEMLDS